LVFRVLSTLSRTLSLSLPRTLSLPLPLSRTLPLPRCVARERESRYRRPW
jgi:hypothetical protein